MPMLDERSNSQSFTYFYHTIFYSIQLLVIIYFCWLITPLSSKETNCTMQIRKYIPIGDILSKRGSIFPSISNRFLGSKMLLWVFEQLLSWDARSYCVDLVLRTKLISIFKYRFKHRNTNIRSTNCQSKQSQC